MPLSSAERSRRYREKNREACIARNKKWFAKNPGKRQEYSRRYKDKNIELSRQRAREYSRRPESRARNAALKKRRYDELLAVTNEIKLSRGCERCGYKEHPVALHFDHIDPLKKTECVGLLINQWPTDEEVFAEIAKCRILCANCHSIKTFEDKDIKKGIARTQLLNGHAPVEEKQLALF